MVFAMMFAVFLPQCPEKSKAFEFLSLANPCSMFQLSYPWRNSRSSSEERPHHRLQRKADTNWAGHRGRTQGEKFLACTKFSLIKLVVVFTLFWTFLSLLFSKSIKKCEKKSTKLWNELNPTPSCRWKNCTRTSTKRFQQTMKSVAAMLSVLWKPHNFKKQSLW